MEILAWLAWGVASVLGFLWSLVWFLISGWVSTLLQIAVLIAIIYFLKYGWQRAPAEIVRRTRSFGRFFWNWLRAREPQTNSAVHVREVVRVVRAKEFGDVNISTLLSLLMFIGLGVGIEQLQICGEMGAIIVGQLIALWRSCGDGRRWVWRHEGPVLMPGAASLIASIVEYTPW